jgi:hypothetical protein
MPRVSEEYSVVIGRLEEAAQHLSELCGSSAHRTICDYLALLEESYRQDLVYASDARVPALQSATKQAMELRKLLRGEGGNGRI